MNFKKMFTETYKESNYINEILESLSYIEQFNIDTAESKAGFITLFAYNTFNFKNFNYLWQEAIDFVGQDNFQEFLYDNDFNYHLNNHNLVDKSNVDVCLLLMILYWKKAKLYQKIEQGYYEIDYHLDEEEEIDEDIIEMINNYHIFHDFFN